MEKGLAKNTLLGGGVPVGGPRSRRAEVVGV